MNLPAIDDRTRVRLWDEKWSCFADERVKVGERPVDVIDRLMGDLPEVRASIDYSTFRWSGYLYRSDGELKIIDNREIDHLIEWPELSI